MAKRKKKAEIKGLYYISHIDNLRSILEQGILFHNTIETKGVMYKAIYDAKIVSNRKLKQTPNGRSL